MNEREASLPNKCKKFYTSEIGVVKVTVYINETVVIHYDDKYDPMYNETPIDPPILKKMMAFISQVKAEYRKVCAK